MKPLAEGEFRFASLVWEHEPINSGELVRLCDEQLNWKKSTVYTVLAKLCDRGILRNDNAIVTARVSRAEYDSQCAGRFVEDSFGGSLPGFLTAFMGGRQLSSAQAEELKRLIDSHKEV